MSDTSEQTPELFPRLKRLRTDLGAFLQLETSGSVLLLIATVAALIVANSSLYPAYEQLLHAKIGLSVGGWSYSASVLHWIDDGLMALFFFVVGLEIKRELVVGELSQPRKALLPLVAALGGMIAPALIYLAINAGGEGAAGWAIPMATDIAFALGVLALLGRRAPAGLRLFLTTLAIADDLGAILVIAIFYSSGISISWLAIAFILLAALYALNRFKVDSAVPYAIGGLLVWFAFLNSGVHATIAGVLVALTIPTTARISPARFIDSARAKLDEIEAHDSPQAHVLDDDEQQEAAFEIRSLAKRSAAPLQRIEHAMHPVSVFFVLPLFAFANAGVRLVDYNLASIVMEPVTIGIFAGLLLGKPLGIATATWIAVRLRLADLPSGVRWGHILGGGVLAAIGFTMSLFISNLAFRDTLLLAEAKLGVLVTSTIAGIGGYLLLRALSKRDATPE